MKLPLRDHQLELLDAMDRYRWAVAILHRRAGKTYGLLWLLIIKTLQTGLKDARYYYIAPTYAAAKAITWDYLLSFLAKAGIPYTANVQELRVDLPNGSRIALLGVESADRLRGRYADGLVLDEAAQMPSDVWLTVLRPMLADRKGFAIFTGTPAGRHNLLAEIYESALADDDWFTMLRTVHDTDALDPAEVKAIKRQISREAFAQEMECSFDSALQGAFYSKEMERAASEGRIGRFQHDPAHPVYCGLDLGYSDALACWYFQRVGNSVQFIAYEEHHQTALPELVDIWHSKPWRLSQVLLPHDAKVRELGTGKSRLETLRGLGVSCQVVRNIGVHDGIEAVRTFFPRCYFDAVECKLGLEALRSYRSSYDPVKRVHAMQPLHDWASHGADALRYVAVGQDQLTTSWQPLDYEEMDRAISW